MRYFNLLKPFLFILLFFSGLVWFAIASFNGLDMRTFVGFLKPLPQVVTADVALSFVFLKWGWKWKLFQGWLVPFPDLNGTWQGHIQTNWRDENNDVPGPIPTILTIKQTFFWASCVMRTAEMESHSYAEDFRIDKERQIRQICYTYTSKPSSRHRHRSTPHDGTILFNIIENPERKLTGEYWTQRQSTGSVKLTFYSKDLLEELPDEMRSHPMGSNDL